MVVVGVGTGRCGTQSIYKLVESQKIAKCRHEFFLGKMGGTEHQRYYTSFGSNSYSRKDLLEKFILLRKDNREKVFFDIGPYYLDIIDDIINMEDVVLFSLKRDANSFSKSFCNYYNNTKGSNNYFRSDQYWNQIGLTPPDVMTEQDANILHSKFYGRLSNHRIVEINTNDLNKESIASTLSGIFSRDFSFKKYHIS